MTPLYNWLLDLVFPIRCLSCRTYTFRAKQGYLCQTCLAKISTKETIQCIGCKRESPDYRTCFLCRPHYSVDRLLIAASYDQPLLVRALTTFKYRFVQDLHRPLSQLIERHLDSLRRKKNIVITSNDPLVIPVPLAGYRLRWRGFNQAELLARDIAQPRGLTVATTVLKRIHHRQTQASSASRVERRENIQKSFECIDPTIVKDRDILLIDDVCTTGATLNECARVLKENGAQYVSAVVIARG